MADKLFTATQVRALDRVAIVDLGIPGYTLMSRAGEGAFGLIRTHWPDARRMEVICGAGNNAGDGYVVARLGLDAGLEVGVQAVIEPGKLSGDAAKAWQDFAAAGGVVRQWSGQIDPATELVVDGLLGTGLDRPVEGRIREAVEAINACGRPVLALDIPTGLHADTGGVLGAAVKARRTATFVGRKIGLYAGEGPELAGDVAFFDLGVPGRVLGDSEFVAWRMVEALRAEVLPRRSRVAHKGSNGRVLIVGGGPGMPGAVRLAGEAALRAGAGLVTVATRPEHAASIVAGRPELICRGVEGTGELEPLLQATDVVALGPGLGQSDWAREVFAAALAGDQPLIIDADGLNLLAGSPGKRDRWVLTPHPGEASRLLQRSTADIQADRLAAVGELVERYGGVAVLKGAGSLVCRYGEPPHLCDRGNPGMATAGMGDVLTGVIAGIAAQCGDLWQAARLGVMAHAVAGDRAAVAGERGLIAGDLMEGLRAWLNHDD